MKYLISGIGPGNSGVGRLMRVLKPKYEQNGYKVIYKREPKSIRAFLNNKSYLLILLELVARQKDRVIFLLKTYFIKNSEVVFLHPQTAGYNLLFKLAHSNQVSFYIMDNSFFCLRSYNTHPITNSECLNCLGSIKPESLCIVFPVKMPHKANIEHLKHFQTVSNKIRFLAQNKLQSELIKKHFGDATSVSVIGMDTSETNKVDAINQHQEEVKSYDVVFHGASLIAKGLLYVVQLADESPDLNFFIPDTKSNIKKTLNRSLPSNIICQAVTWETGLKELVTSAKVVINPSMWSAPIEGALLKSAAFNPNVATVKTEYGFEKEITTIKNHLRLEKDAKSGAKQLKEYLKETL